MPPGNALAALLPPLQPALSEPLALGVIAVQVAPVLDAERGFIVEAANLREGDDGTAGAVPRLRRRPSDGIKKRLIFGEGWAAEGLFGQCYANGLMSRAHLIAGDHGDVPLPLEVEQLSIAVGSLGDDRQGDGSGR